MCTCDAGIGTRLAAPPDGVAWLACTCDAFGAEWSVSPTGDDANPGTLAAPFLTLARAESAIEDAGVPAGGSVVWVRGGAYELASSLTIGSGGSGSDAGAVVWRGYPGEVAELIGGHRLDVSAFATVTSADPVWTRLDPSAQGQVASIDLSSQGVTDYGALTERGFCASGNHAALVSSRSTAEEAASPCSPGPTPTTTPLIVPSNSATSLQIYGPGLVPDVSGTYAQNGTGGHRLLLFARDGLTDGGAQYKPLYRYSWTYRRAIPTRPGSSPRAPRAIRATPRRGGATRTPTTSPPSAPATAQWATRRSSPPMRSTTACRRSWRRARAPYSPTRARAPRAGHRRPTSLDPRPPRLRLGRLPPGREQHRHRQSGR